MEFIYGKAPLNYIDTVPSHKAGEWPGIKSCKFHSYKRVIRPVDCGIIFNEKEPLLPSKRKLLGRTEPTPEYVFRSSSRKVPIPGSEHASRREGLRYISFPTKENIPRKERRHVFPYKKEMEKVEKENDLKMTTAKAVMNEFKLLGVIGFAKKPYLGISNKQLNNYKFSTNRFGQLKFDDTNINNNDYMNMTKTQKKNYNKLKKAQQEKNYNSDVNYVSNLTNWDKKFIGDNKKQVTIPNTETHDNNNINTNNNN